MFLTKYIILFSSLLYIVLSRHMDFRERFLERKRQRALKDQRLKVLNKYVLKNTAVLDDITHYRNRKVNGKSLKAWMAARAIEKDFRRLLAMDGMKYNYKRDWYWRTWRSMPPVNNVTDQIVSYKCNNPIHVNTTECQNCGMWTIEEQPPPCPFEFFSVLSEDRLCGANYTQYKDVNNTCPSVIKFTDLTATCDNPIQTQWRFSKMYGVTKKYEEVICKNKDFCDILTLYEIKPGYVVFRIINSTNDVIYSRIMKPKLRNYICVHDCGRFNPSTRKVTKVDKPLKLDLLVPRKIKRSHIFRRINEKVTKRAVPNEMIESVTKRKLVNELNESVMRKVLLNELNESVTKRVVSDEMIESVTKRKLSNELNENVMRRVLLNELNESVIKRVVSDEMIESVTKRKLWNEMTESVTKRKLVNELNENVMRRVLLNELNESVTKRVVSDEMIESVTKRKLSNEMNENVIKRLSNEMNERVSKRRVFLDDINVSVTKRGHILHENKDSMVPAKESETKEVLNYILPAEEKNSESNDKDKDFNVVSMTESVTKRKLVNELNESVTKKVVSNEMIESFTKKKLWNEMTESVTKRELSNEMTESVTKRELSNEVTESVTKRELSNEVTESVTKRELSNEMTESVTKRKLLTELNESVMRRIPLDELNESVTKRELSNEMTESVTKRKLFTELNESVMRRILLDELNESVTKRVVSNEMIESVTKRELSNEMTENVIKRPSSKINESVSKRGVFLDDIKVSVTKRDHILHANKDSMVPAKESETKEVLNYILQAEEKNSESNDKDKDFIVVSIEKNALDMIKSWRLKKLQSNIVSGEAISLKPTVTPAQTVQEAGHMYEEFENDELV